jgi:hypothetical protein
MFFQQAFERDFELPIAQLSMDRQGGGQVGCSVVSGMVGGEFTSLAQTSIRARKSAAVIEGAHGAGNRHVAAASWTSIGLGTKRRSYLRMEWGALLAAPTANS